MRPHRSSSLSSKMKRPLSSASSALLASIVAFAAMVSVATSAPQGVEVSGIAIVGKVKSAVLVIDQPSTTETRSVLLKEGEADGRIRLLSVNAAAASVQIDNCGLIQTLRISAAANFSKSFIAAMVKDAAQALAQEADSPGENKTKKNPIDLTMVPGNPGWSALPPIDSAARQAARQTLDRVAAAKNSGAASAMKNMISSDSSLGAGVDSPAPSASSTALPDWYVESISIEQDRLTTASEVLAGKTMPLPRTPLTPATTPAYLVDSVNGVYANRMADFITHDWSQM